MGVQDRDWYRDAQREREKQRGIDKTRAAFSAYSRKHLGTRSGTTSKTSWIPALVFWGIAMGLVYGAMTYYLKPKPPRVQANGDLVITRSQDGHFYAMGTINGREARFMVDTGASMVSVSEGFAQKAFIRGGVPTTFKTANGDRPGRIVDGLGVSIGPVSVTNVRVGVGLRMDDEDSALLGQSFLSKFDVTMSGSQMVLRPR